MRQVLFLIISVLGLGSCEADSVSDLKQLVRDNEVRAVEQLVEKGRSLKGQDQWGFNALFLARSPEMVELLVSNGVNPNHVAQGSRDQQTPLHTLTIGFNISPSVIKALVDNGADPSIKDKYGKSVIDYAEELVARYPREGSYAEKLRILQGSEKQGQAPSENGEVGK